VFWGVFGVYFGVFGGYFRGCLGMFWKYFCSILEGFQRVVNTNEN